MNKLTGGVKVLDIPNLDETLVVSSSRIPSDWKRLRGIDFSGTNLSGIVLFRADLSYAIIEEGKKKKHTNIQNVNLCQANLCGAKLIEANLNNSDLSNAKLFNALMYGVDLSDATLLRADLSGIKLVPQEKGSEEKKYRKAKFCNANLGDTNISDGRMMDVDLSNSDLYRANLCDADLSRAILENTKLSYAILANANLSHAKLENTILSNSNLSEANLVGVDLSKANLSDADLSNAKVYEADTRTGIDNTQRLKLINELLVKTIPESESDIPVLPYIIALFCKEITAENIKVSLRQGKYKSTIENEKIFHDSQDTLTSTKFHEQENDVMNVPLIPLFGSSRSNLIFKPSSQLKYYTDYTVTIKDSQGKMPLKEWSFTTTSKLTREDPLKVLEVTGSGHDGNIFQNTIDDDLFTRWSNYGKGEDSWIKFDLGSEYDICALDIAWHKGDKRIYDFEISTSLNDKYFLVVQEGTKDGRRSSRKSLHPQRDVFGRVKARYVKITVNGNTQNNWASIAEIDIYGC